MSPLHQTTLGFLVHNNQSNFLQMQLILSARVHNFLSCRWVICTSPSTYHSYQECLVYILRIWLTTCATLPGSGSVLTFHAPKPKLVPGGGQRLCRTKGFHSGLAIALHWRDPTDARVVKSHPMTWNFFHVSVSVAFFLTWRAAYPTQNLDFEASYFTCTLGGR